MTESLATLQHQIAMQTKRERDARKLQKAICNAVCYDDDFAKAWLFGESDYQSVCVSLGLDPIWLSDALKEALAISRPKRYLTLVHRVEPCYNDIRPLGDPNTYNDICPYETDPNSNGTSPTKKV